MISKLSRSKVLFIADLPGPLHGMSLCNDFYYKVFVENDFDLLTFNTNSINLFHKVLVYFCVYIKLPLAILRSRCVYISVYGGASAILQLPLVAFSRFLKRSVFVHHHSYNYLNKFSFLHFMLSRFRLTHIFLSEAMENSYVSMYGSVNSSFILDNNLVVYGKFYEFGRLSANEHCFDQKFTLGYFSNVSLEKGIDIFLSDIDYLQGFIDCDYLIGGRLADCLGSDIEMRILESNCYVGPLYGGDKFLEFFDRIDIFYFPTLYRNEAMPLVVYEAMLAGCAVISFDIGTIRTQLSSVAGNCCIDPSLSVEERRTQIASFLDNFALNKDARRNEFLRTIESSQSELVSFLGFLNEI